MKRFKKILCGLLVIILMVCMILPMLPTLEAKAADAMLPGTKETVGRGEITIENVDGSTTDGISPSDYLISGEVIKLDSSLKFIDDDRLYGDGSILDNGVDNVLDSVNSGSGLKLVKDCINEFGNNIIDIDTNYSKDIYKYFTKVDALEDTCMVAEYYIMNRQKSTTDTLYYAIGVNKRTCKVYTVICTAIAGNDNYQSSLGLYVLDGIFDVEYTNETEESAVYSVNAMSLLDGNDNIKLGAIVANVLNEDILKVMSSDFENGNISETNISLYKNVDSVLQLIDTTKDVNNAASWVSKAKEYISNYTVMAISTKGKFEFSEKDGKKVKEIFGSGNIRLYNILVGGGIDTTITSVAKSEESESTSDGSKGAVRLIILDTKNKDFINFGDSTELSYVDGNDDKEIKDFKNALGWTLMSSTPKVRDVPMNNLVQLVNSVCHSATGDNVNDFSVKLDTWVNSMPEGSLKKIFSSISEEMKNQANGWVISEIQGDLSGSNTIDADNSFDAISKILEMSIICSYNKVSIAGTYKYKSRYTYVSNYFADVPSEKYLNLPDGDKYNIQKLWDELTSYQKDLLAITYRNIIDSRDIYYSGAIISDIYNYGIKGIYSHDTAEKFVEEGNSQIIDTIQQTVKNKDANLIDTYSVYNIARNANTLGQYIVGISLYGENDDNSLYNLYDATLAGFIKKDYTQAGINTTWYPEYLPREIGLFGENSKYYTILLSSQQGFEAFASFLYNVSYAFDVAAFSDGAQENYDPETLQKYFATGTYEKSTDDEEDTNDGVPNFSWFTGNSLKELNGETVQITDDVSINMLKSIIELHDLCEFLQIPKNGWTEAISIYLDIYDDNKDFFDGIRNNPTVYTSAAKGENTVDEPLGSFFNISDKKMSDQWCKGFALSALYVPMETNLYDANSVAYLNDPEFIADFYYKFAFYRKALYINTDNSAIVNGKVADVSSGKRVATLKDLLNYDRDIILTVDTGFYNARDINDIIGKLDYTAVRNGSDTNTDTGWTNVKNWVSELFDISPAQILKTGSNSYYSTTLANNVTKFNHEVTLKSSIADAYILPESNLIGADSVFNDYEYSVKQSYGVVSSIYRSASLYNECLRAIASDNAIFKSSKNICSVAGTNSSDWRSIYNYAMLANLEDQMKNDAASTLDVNSPIFCDLFGNILTESGLVIIPAAANATLCGSNWNPNTVGWSEYYNNGNRVKINEFSDDVYSWLTGVTYTSQGTTTTQVQIISGYDDDGNPIYKTATVTANDEVNTNQYGEDVKHTNAGGYFIVDRSGQLVLRTTSLTGQGSTAIVQWESLNKNSTVIKQLFYNDSYFTKAGSGDIYSKTLVNLVVETLRGAPIEYIDYEYEGLSGNAVISKVGVFMAYKLEELTNVLISGTNGNGAVNTGGNSLVTIPNPAFITGIEYIVLYIFKVAFAIMLLGFAFSLYLDAVKNHLGIKSVFKFVYTCLLILISVLLVPQLISWSYYKANKDLLADEAGYIMMLNYVKEYDGSEIGITSVTTPETNTELYVKLDDITVEWWNIIYEVLFNNTYQTVSELYESQLTDNAMAMQENVQVKGDGLYMNVQDIFDSTNIVYYPNQNMISNIAYSNSASTESTPGDKNSVVSFVMPYYVILDKLVASINEYNTSKDITAYSWSVGTNGHIMTYDIVSPYFTSSEFLDEGFDILGLNEVLQTGRGVISYTDSLFTEDSVRKMKMSRWYPNGDTTDDNTQTRIGKLYEYARDYIAQNRSVLGKVPDEVFLKTFAMQLAIEYNKIFNIHTTNSIELMNVDTRDLARFLVADKANVYKYYSYGYARFVYEQGGGIGVILAALYLLTLWLTSGIKLIALAVILSLFIVNMLLRKILFRKESRCVEGYFIGCACLVLSNYAYAGMLKVSMSITQFGLGFLLAMLVAILVQIAYVLCLLGIVIIEVKDWKNNGFSEFQAMGASITSGLLHAQSVVADKLISKKNEAYSGANKGSNISGDYDSSSIDEMLDRDAERVENGTYNIV